MIFQRDSALEKNGCYCEHQRSSLPDRYCSGFVLVGVVAQEVAFPHLSPFCFYHLGREGPSLMIGRLLEH